VLKRFLEDLGLINTAVRLTLSLTTSKTLQTARSNLWPTKSPVGSNQGLNNYELSVGYT
jgi:hypothetical protein